MTETPSSPVLQLIRRSFGDPAARDSADRELLRRFLESRDAGAFEAILRRHGPMVLDVCRTVLGNEADAEDAFQATFLVLARTAASIREAGSLAAWLHGVARRTALKARADSTRRRVTALAVPERGAVDADDLSWREVRQVLHEELDALPERVQGPLVLCYLEGMTLDRAAARLGLTKGTLRRRLEHGRELLRARLVRRGLGAALALAAAWPAAAAAGVRRDVVTAVVGAACGTVAVIPPRAAALAEGVLKTMYLTKLKVIGIAVVVCAALAMAGVAGRAAFPHRESPQPDVREPSSRAGGAPDVREPGATWKARATLIGHGDEVVCLAFGPDRLATAGKDGSVKLWNTATGKEKWARTYPAEDGPMEAMAFTPDGTSLLVAFGDQLARWGASGEDRPVPKAVALDAVPLPAKLSVDGLWVLRRDAQKRWAWEQRSELPRPQLDVALTDKGFASRAVLRRAAGTTAALSPGTATLAVGSTDGALTLWDVRTRKELGTCKGHTNDILALEFSPDGKTLVSAGKDGTVRLWDAATGKELAILRGHAGPVRAVAFSPDGGTLASGGDDNTVAVWDVKAAKRLAVLDGRPGAVLTVAFSRDGKLLASAGKDKTVRLWEPKGAECPDVHKDSEPPRPPLNAPQQPEFETRIEQYERAFRVQTALGYSKPIKTLVTLDKITTEEARSGESRSISASLATRDAGDTAGKPLKFDNLAVSEDARITDNGKAIRFADLEPPTLVRIELEPRSGTFVVVGIEKVGTVK